MRILALDCSAKAVSVAIAEEGRLIGEGFLNIPLTHSETLMPLMEQVLSNTRLTLQEIDAIAVTAGPGSFTGVRIGISAVKGLCFSEQKPTIAFSALEAMALGFAGGAGANGLLCGLMDARREQFYNALFQVENGVVTRLTEDRIITAEALRQELHDQYANLPIILAGDGAELFHTLTKQDTAFATVPPTQLIQRAAGIAVFASRPEFHRPLTPPEALQPIYLRKSQAEREREAKLSASI